MSVLYHLRQRDASGCLLSLNERGIRRVHLRFWVNPYTLRSKACAWIGVAIAPSLLGNHSLNPNVAVLRHHFFIK